MVVSGDLFKIYFDKDVDLKLIKENLTTKQSRLEQEMNKISQRLENKSFVSNSRRAPEGFCRALGHHCPCGLLDAHFLA